MKEQSAGLSQTARDPEISAHKPVFGIFGIYRWILASTVFLSHLGPLNYVISGTYAVYCFYMLSGYVISFILDTRYLHLRYGIVRFYVNRMLRIYPAYWIVMAASIPLIMQFPIEAHAVNGWMTMPRDTLDWLKNIIILGMLGQFGSISGNMIIPIAWSLALEIQWWLIMPHLMRKPEYERQFLILSVAIAFALFLIDIHGKSHWGFAFYYTPLLACRFFALGLLIYLWRKRGGRNMSPILGMTALVLLLTINCWPHSVSKLFGIYEIYIVFGSNALVLYYLSGIESGCLQVWLRWLDKLLGSLAYPLFLLNTIVSLSFTVLFPWMEYRSWLFFLTSFVVANLLALLISACVEFPLKEIRNYVKA